MAQGVPKGSRIGPREYLEVRCKGRVQKWPRTSTIPLITIISLLINASGQKLILLFKEADILVFLFENCM